MWSALPFSCVCWCAAVSTDCLCARRLQAFDDFMTAAACSFTLTVNDEEKPQIEQSSCPTAVVGTKGLPPWPELAASDNSGDEVDIKALVTSRTRDGMVITEVTSESALTGAHAYTFRGASADSTEAHCCLALTCLVCVPAQRRTRAEMSRSAAPRSGCGEVAVWLFSQHCCLLSRPSSRHTHGQRIRSSDS